MGGIPIPLSPPASSFQEKPWCRGGASQGQRFPQRCVTLGQSLPLGTPFPHWGRGSTQTLPFLPPWWVIDSWLFAWVTWVEGVIWSLDPRLGMPPPD